MGTEVEQIKLNSPVLIAEKEQNSSTIKTTKPLERGCIAQGAELELAPMDKAMKIFTFMALFFSSI
jgi:hypothetical protein